MNLPRNMFWCEGAHQELQVRESSGLRRAYAVILRGEQPRFGCGGPLPWLSKAAAQAERLRRRPLETLTCARRCGERNTHTHTHAHTHTDVRQTDGTYRVYGPQRYVCLCCCGLFWCGAAVNLGVLLIRILFGSNTDPGGIRYNFTGSCFLGGAKALRL